MDPAAERERLISALQYHRGLLQIGTTIFLAELQSIQEQVLQHPVCLVIQLIMLRLEIQLQDVYHQQGQR